MRVLLLGADGFIGRHIGFYLRDQGVAVALRPDRLAAMGCDTWRADLTDAAHHSPKFWAAHLPPHPSGERGGAADRNRGRSQGRACSGPPSRAGRPAPYQPCRADLGSGHRCRHAIAHWCRETKALFAAHTILRPGLVLADTS